MLKGVAEFQLSVFQFSAFWVFWGHGQFLGFCQTALETTRAEGTDLFSPPFTPQVR